MRKLFLPLAVILFSFSAFAQEEASSKRVTDSLKDSQPAIEKQIENNLAESLKAHAMQDFSPYARRLIRAASDPSSAIEGQVYANTTSHVPKFYNGSAWKTFAFTDAVESPLTFNSPLSRTGNIISCSACGGSGGSGEQLLSTTANVNLNITTAQDLYTVPTGKTLATTRVVIRNASTDITGCTSTSGFNIIDSGSTLNLLRDKREKG
jgi:hypothetical protein